MVCRIIRDALDCNPRRFYTSRPQWAAINNINGSGRSVGVETGGVSRCMNSTKTNMMPPLPPLKRLTPFLPVSLSVRCLRRPLSAFSNVAMLTMPL